MADGDEESFPEAFYKEVSASGVDTPMVDALIHMVPDYDTIADTLGYMAESGSPDLAAAVLRRLMKAGGTGPSSSQNGTKPQSADKPSYKSAALVLNRMVESQNMPVALEILKFLLVAKDTAGGNGKMLDCYDVSLVFGTMAEEGKADNAGRLLYAFYTEEQPEQSQAAQTLVPFVLGTLLDHNHADWAVDLGLQLMYTTLEEIDAGSEEYDYSVMGWCMAQMVWFGRADWAARLCVELQKRQLDWYEHGAMMGSVTSWGDPTYAQTINNFMRDAHRQQGPTGGGGGRGHH